MDENRHTPLSQDAAVVMALAGTAMPFAHSAEDEAERWLRALRMHGEVGAALQAIGIGESPLMTGSERSDSGRKPLGPGAVEEVTMKAKSFAARRQADAVGTVDVLFAVMDVYDRLFDRALYLRGSSRDELFERLVDTPRAHNGV